MVVIEIKFLIDSFYFKGFVSNYKFRTTEI